METAYIVTTVFLLIVCGILGYKLFKKPKMRGFENTALGELIGEVIVMSRHTIQIKFPLEQPFSIGQKVGVAYFVKEQKITPKDLPEIIERENIESYRKITETVEPIVTKEEQMEIKKEEDKPPSEEWQEIKKAVSGVEIEKFKRED